NFVSTARKDSLFGVYILVDPHVRLIAGNRSRQILHEVIGNGPRQPGIREWEQILQRLLRYRTYHGGWYLIIRKRRSAQRVVDLLAINREVTASQRERRDVFHQHGLPR